MGERILLCVDVGDEMLERWEGKGKQHLARLLVIREVLKNFLHTKASMHMQSRHQFALVLLGHQRPRWVLDFTNDLAEIETALFSHTADVLREGEVVDVSGSGTGTGTGSDPPQPPCPAFDFSLLFSLIQHRVMDELHPNPGVADPREDGGGGGGGDEEHKSSSGSSSGCATVVTSKKKESRRMVTRAILVFARSGAIPVISDPAACKELLNHPMFFLDVLYVHRRLATAPLAQDVYDFLTHELESSSPDKKAFFFESSASYQRLCKNVAMLLAHAVQRAPQSEFEQRFEETTQLMSRSIKG